MKFCWISLVFGLAFFIVKLVDVTISSSDVFGWITTIDNSCNLSNETGLIISKDPLTWVFFGISVLIIVVFLVVFCSSCVCSCCISKDRDYNTTFGLATLKLFLEIAIIAAFFDPVSNVNLLLRDCLAGYLMVSIQITVYFLAVFVTVAVVELGFRHKNQSPKWKCIHTMMNIIVTICQSTQVIGCVFGFTMFFEFVIKMDNNAIKYGYLAVTIVVSLFVWIKNTIERLSFYLFLVKRDNKKRLCYFPNFLTTINFICYIILISLIAKYFNSNKKTLFIISLIFLAISAAINIFHFLCNCFCCCVCQKQINDCLFDVEEEEEEQLLRIDDNIDNDAL